MAVPNLLNVVNLIKAKHPEAWRTAHTGGSHSEDFINLLASECHRIDPRFGLNGKRGNPLDLSDDALCFKGEGADFDPTAGGAPRTVIDVIGAAGSPSAFPTWAVVTNPASPVGAAWVQPRPVVVVPDPVPPHVCPPCPPPPPTFPYPDEQTIGKAFQLRVRQAYRDAGRDFPDPNDMDAFRHFVRYGYSCRSMPEAEAAEKHIKELRAQLGV